MSGAGHNQFVGTFIYTWMRRQEPIENSLQIIADIWKNNLWNIIRVIENVLCNFSILKIDMTRKKLVI